MLFNLAALVSAVLCALVCAAWFRSVRVADYLTWYQVIDPNGHDYPLSIRTFVVWSEGGVLLLSVSGPAPTESVLPLTTWQFSPLHRTSDDGLRSYRPNGFSYAVQDAGGGWQDRAVSAPYWFLAGATMVLPAIWLIRRRSVFKRTKARGFDVTPTDPVA